MTADQTALDQALAEIRELSRQIAALVDAYADGTASLTDPAPAAALIALTDRRAAAERRFDVALAEVDQ